MLPPNSIHAWNKLANTILHKEFPLSKKEKIRDNIFHFQQIPREQLVGAWERFKQLLLKSVDEFSGEILLEKLYLG